MKKTLLAAAAAAACSAGALAANVQVYGVIDTGFTYTHTKSDMNNVASKNTFEMDTGNEFGSRWGLRGTEDLGNGLKVGFVLESGIKSDTGTLDQGGKLFGRESHVDLMGNFGTLRFGLMPVLGSTLGADGLFKYIDPLFANYVGAFGSGAVTASSWTRIDNAITYRTPEFAGLTVMAQYSFKNDDNKDAQEGKAETDRYAAIGAHYHNGGFTGVLVGDMTMYGSVSKPETNKNQLDIDYGTTWTLGGNYAFDNGVKVLAFGQYFEDQYLNHMARAGVGLDTLNKFTEGKGYGYMTGWGASLGVHVPLAGGVLKGQVAYRDAHNQNDIDFNRWIVAAGYDYSLSKRTAVYVMTGYSQEKMENVTTKKEHKPSGCELVFGMVHRF